MMAMLDSRHLRVLLLIFLSSASGLVAQESSSAPTTLALEITYYPGRKPAYQTVGTSAEHGWAWYGMFARIEAWKPPEGQPMIRAVHIIAYNERDAARVIVAVLSGERRLESRQKIAEYLVKENEKINLEELRQFGIEPFEIRLIRVSPTSTAVPHIFLKGVDSLVVVNATVDDSTLPSYRISLFNQSGKNILALRVRVEVVAGGKIQTTGVPRGQDGRALIEAGSTYELTVRAPMRAREAPGGYEPITLSDQAVQISAAVFDDGTFEGDSTTAATVKAFRATDKQILSRLLPLLERAINQPAGDVGEALKTLEQQVTLQTRDGHSDTDQTDASGSKRERPGDGGGVEVFSPPILADLLKTIHQLQTNYSLTMTGYRSWLSVTKERYEKWLARL